MGSSKGQRGSLHVIVANLHADPSAIKMHVYIKDRLEIIIIGEGGGGEEMQLIKRLQHSCALSASCQAMGIGVSCTILTLLQFVYDNRSVRNISSPVLSWIWLPAVQQTKTRPD